MVSLYCLLAEDSDARSGPITNIKRQTGPDPDLSSLTPLHPGPAGPDPDLSSLTPLHPGPAGVSFFFLPPLPAKLLKQKRIIKLHQM